VTSVTTPAWKTATVRARPEPACGTPAPHQQRFWHIARFVHGSVHFCEKKDDNCRPRPFRRKEETNHANNSRQYRIVES
jgi:hypothetical protein